MRLCFRFISIILTLSLYQVALQAQSIEFYADVMINADRPEHRVLASEAFAEKFGEELAQEESFTLDFAEIPWISIQYPEDSTFRSITWQIDEGEGKYSYHGYLQSNEGDLYTMAGKRGRSTARSNDELSFSQWKGGLIYKILTLPTASDQYYLLSYSAIDEYTKVKTLEPIRFEEGTVILGRKGLFDERPEAGSLTARLALQYSMDANAGITYDETSRRLVFDNLVVVQGRMPGQGPTTVPDGSYKAFEYSPEGRWTYIEKLFSQWNEGPLEDNRNRLVDRQLFNKKKNRK